MDKSFQHDLDENDHLKQYRVINIRHKNQDGISSSRGKRILTHPSFQKKHNQG